MTSFAANAIPAFMLLHGPSVFVWGPEACLSTVFVGFLGRLIVLR